MDDLRVGNQILIPAAELEWTFTPSGGPGGQHANRSNTRAELRWDLAGSESLNPSLRQRLVEKLGRRLVGGAIIVASDQSRSQWRNRVTARRRLAALIEDALVQTPPRRPTKPSRAARQERLDSKRHRSEVKRLRRPPEQSDG